MYYDATMVCEGGAMLHRYEVYNEDMKLVEEMARRGNAFLLRPRHPVRHMEADPVRMEEGYAEGRQDAERSCRNCWSIWTEHPAEFQKSHKKFIFGVDLFSRAGYYISRVHESAQPQNRIDRRFVDLEN